MFMFLFIAYKPSSEYYCCGCHVASYKSNHEIYNWLNADGLINIWSKYLNLNLGCGEDGYTFYVFKDGIQVWNGNYSTWDGYQRYEYDTDEYWEHYNKLEKQEENDLTELFHIKKQAEDLAAIKQKEKMVAEETQHSKAKLEAETKTKEYRRKQFEELQKEFGSEH